MSPSATRAVVLPPELKLQILLEDVLSREDFARICRVDKSWLACAREVLFETIVVEMRWTADEDREQEKEEDKGRGGLSERGFRLLCTLQDDPQLANLVKSINFRSFVSFNRKRRSVSHAIAAFLEACATVESVSFDHQLGQSFREYILPYVSLKVDSLTMDDMWTAGSEENYPFGPIAQENLHNLRRLECEYIGDFSDAARVIKPERSLVNLEILKLTSHYRAFPASYTPKLRILQFPLLALDGSDRINWFSTLQSLHLCAPGPSLIHVGTKFVDLRVLSHLPSLRFLSITIYTNDEVSDKGLAGFLQQLPPLLTHLVFPSRLPFDVVLPLIPSLHSITDFGVSRPLPHEKRKQINVDKLRSSCVEKGIKLYFAPREVNVMKL